MLLMVLPCIDLVLSPIILITKLEKFEEFEKFEKFESKARLGEGYLIKSSNALLLGNLQNAVQSIFVNQHLSIS